MRISSQFLNYMEPDYMIMQSSVGCNVSIVQCPVPITNQSQTLPVSSTWQLRVPGHWQEILPPTSTSLSNPQMVLTSVKVKVTANLTLKGQDLKTEGSNNLIPKVSRCVDSSQQSKNWSQSRGSQTTISRRTQTPREQDQQRSTATVCMTL